jgi:hypothetical protein
MTIQADAAGCFEDVKANLSDPEAKFMASEV